MASAILCFATVINPAALNVACSLFSVSSCPLVISPVLAAAVAHDVTSARDVERDLGSRSRSVRDIDLGSTCGLPLFKALICLMLTSSVCIFGKLCPFFLIIEGLGGGGRSGAVISSWWELERGGIGWREVLIDTSGFISGKKRTFLINFGLSERTFSALSSIVISISPGLTKVDKCSLLNAPLLRPSSLSLV